MSDRSSSKQSAFYFLHERLGWKREHLFPVIALAASALALNCLGLFSQKFFRDFTIIFEGGYRIYLGQIPFKDFYIPIGPVALYLQALFDFLAGPSLWASALHAGTLAAVLCAVYYLVTVPQLGKPLSFFLGIALFFSYTGIINYPWYNETAFFFFLLNALLLIGKLDAKASPSFLGFSAVLAVLGIFSKQDIGLLHFAALGAYFFYSDGWKKTFQFYILPAFALTAVIAACFQSMGNFLYWFNYGQKPSISRLSLLLNRSLLFTVPFWALLLCVLVYFKWHLTKAQEKRLFLLVILIFVPFITSYTSGNPDQTRVQGLPIILYLIQDLVQTPLARRVKYPGKIIWAAHLAAVLILIQPLPVLGKYILGNFFVGQDAKQPAFIRSLLSRYDYLNHVKIAEGAYKGCVIHKGYNFFLEQIKDVLGKTGGSFYNMTEYQFLYTDFKAAPPKQVPLWLDHGISYFTPDLPYVRDTILARRDRVILLQDPHTNELRQIKFYLFTQFSQNGYKHLFTALAPAIAKIEVLVRD